MAVKPLPEKKQKLGKRLSLIISIIFGLILGGSIAAFVGLTLNIKNDKQITTQSGPATSLKDTGDGFLYATEENHLILCDYDNKVKSDLDIAEAVSEYNLGEINRVDSINYNPETENLYVTSQFVKEEVYTRYLYKFERSGDEFRLSTAGYVEVESAVTAFLEHNNYFYAIIRKATYCTIVRFDSNNLAGATDKGYLYEKLFEYDDKTGELSGFTYTYTYNPVVYSLKYIESMDGVDNANLIVVVSDKGLFAIKDGTFSNLGGSQRIQVSLQDDIYSNYLFYQYTSLNNSPRGVVDIDNRCYMITKGLGMAYFDYDELPISIPDDEEEPEVDEVLVNGFSYSKAAPISKTGLYYNEVCKKGVIITEKENIITYLDMSDFNNIKTLFVAEAEVNITDVVITNDGNNIYYLCQNSEVNNSTSRMLNVKSVEQTFKNMKNGKYTPVLLVAAIISLVLFVITLLCAVKKMFLENFLAFLKNIKLNWVAYIILLICLTLLGMFCYYPAVGSISMSFFNYKSDQPIVWNNFKNYIKIFTDPTITRTFGNMVFFLIADIVTAIIPPLIFAFFLTVMKSKKVSAVTRTLLFLPSVIPGITKMMIWQNGIYGERGVINAIVKLFQGEPIVFLNGSNFDIWAIVLMGFPYVGSYLVFYGAMMNIPSSYYEAAELEGLNVWKRFFTIDIPLIKAQIKYVVILTIIASVQNFGRTYMLTSALAQDKAMTPIHLMYRYITNGDYGLSSAIAAILFVLLLVFTIFNLRKQKDKLGDAI